MSRCYPGGMPDQSTNRYARQVSFHPIGEEGQKRLAGSDVAILGCGALGTVAAEILTRAGIGSIRVIDRDVVEWSNLQRQALFTEQDAELGRSKSEAAVARLTAINVDVKLKAEVADVHAGNIDGLLSGCDLVIDASDNFSLRFLLNDWSLKTATPWSHGGCVGATGQVHFFEGHSGPCFRCFVPNAPPPDASQTCDTAGVVGAATHAIASFQAMESIKWLSGNRDRVRSKLLSIDFWENRIRELTLHRLSDNQCIACGQQDYEYLTGIHSITDQDAIVLCGRDAVQLAPSKTAPGTINLHRLAERWQTLGTVQETPFFVRLRQPDQSRFTITVFRDGRTVIDGTSDFTEARTLRDRYIGG